MSLLDHAFLRDSILLLGYPIQHSVLAANPVKKFFHRRIPNHWYRLLYAITAALYILVAGALWVPIPTVVYSFSGIWREIFILIGLIGWIGYAYSHLFYYDVGGVFGTSQLFHKISGFQPPRFDFSTNGLKAYIRFPVHTFFLPMFWGTPTMTESTLLFSIVGSFYAWFGTLHHDHRYTKAFGKPYIEYQKVTGMVFPKLRRSHTNIRDSAPRKEAVLSIAVLSVVLIIPAICFAYFIAPFHKMSLSLIPLTTVLCMFIVGVFLTIFHPSLWYRGDGLDGKRIEQWSFTMGVITGVYILMSYLFSYLLNHQLPTLVAAIPTWVLGQIAGSFGCFIIARIPQVQSQKESNWNIGSKAHT